jgi:hypothetical protein
VTRISACSFIVEPDIMWKKRIDRSHYDDAPVIRDVDGEPVFLCPGHPKVRIALKDVPWVNDRGSSADPFVRIPQLEAEGIDAEVIFPTLSWALLDAESALKSACLRAYNSWLWNITTSSPKRFHGVALLPTGPEAVTEIERIALLKLKAAIAPVTAIGSELSDLSAAAVLAGVPLMLARVGGATPLSSLAAFSAESAELTDQALKAGAKAKFLVIGTPNGSTSDGVKYITGDPSVASAAPDRAFWGRLGVASTGAADGQPAADYFDIAL